MGCSLYFTVTETHPLLLLDIFKATYLLSSPDGPFLSTALIVSHAIAFQKHQSHLAVLVSNVYATHSSCLQHWALLSQPFCPIDHSFPCVPVTILPSASITIMLFLSSSLFPTLPPLPYSHCMLLSLLIINIFEGV